MAQPLCICNRHRYAIVLSGYQYIYGLTSRYEYKAGVPLALSTSTKSERITSYPHNNSWKQLDIPINLPDKTIQMGRSLAYWFGHRPRFSFTETLGIHTHMIVARTFIALVWNIMSFSARVQQWRADGMICWFRDIWSEDTRKCSVHGAWHRQMRPCRSRLL